jgi:RNA polymerase sigma factor (sigma-70 family)
VIRRITKEESPMVGERYETAVSGAVPRTLHVGEEWLHTAAAKRRAITIAESDLATGQQNAAPDEQSLFTALRVCAYWAGKPNGDGPVASAGQEQWARRRRVIRDYLVQRNLGLVYWALPRFAAKSGDDGPLLSDALLALLQAVDCFDPWRGIRFSSYAVTAIQHALIYRRTHEQRYRRRFPASFDVAFEHPVRRDENTELYEERLHRALDANLGDLTLLEARVLAQRYPLDHEPPSTLRAIGGAEGLSKERVRQIQNRALRKLREVLVADLVLR